MEFAVGVTTAPRKPSTLRESVTSIVAAGFPEPLVFAEPDANVDGVRNVTVRPRTIADGHFGGVTGRYGAWRNWVQTLADLLKAKPNSSAILIVQDDVRFCRGAAEFLSHDLWPSENTGVVQLCTSVSYRPVSRTGCNRISRIRDRKFLAGAWACLFPRHVAEQILKHPLSKTWKGWHNRRIKEPVKKKGIDTYIGHVIVELGYNAFVYRPSLAEHFASTSTLGHGGIGGNRRTLEFPGVNADAHDALGAGLPWVRYTLPGGDQRFMDQPALSTDPVSVVIPAHGAEDLTMRCLDHVAQNAGIPVEVIYVDNGSPKGVADVVEKHAKHRGLPIRVIRNDSNVGFTKAVNLGIFASQGRHVLILNNDCFVGPKCLMRMKRHLEWHPRIAAVGPLTGDNGCCSLKRPAHVKNAGLVGQELKLGQPHYMAKLCNRCYVAPVSMLPFFCTMLHRDAIKELGMLHDVPEFESGLAVDDEWCHRALKKRWKCLLCYDAFATHLHSQTFKRLKLDRSRRSPLMKKAMGKLKTLTK